MKTHNEIIEYLKGAIEDVTLGNIKRDKINDDSFLMDDIGLDSLDYASIMLSGETFASIKIDENNVNWRNVRTVAELAELLYKCQI